MSELRSRASDSSGEHQPGAVARRRAFFERVLDGFLDRFPDIRRPKVGDQNWITIATGRFRRFVLSFAMHKKLRVETYLDTGDTESSKAIFDKLRDERDEIESAFGQSLSWERLDKRRASRVAAYRPAPNLENADQTDEAVQWSVDTMSRLIDVFDSRILETAEALVLSP